MPDEPVYPPDATPLPGNPPPPPERPAYQPVMPPGATGSPADTTTGLAPNVAAGLAVLCSFISGIIFLVLEKRSQFVRFWAMQSTVVGLGLFAFHIATWILGFILAAIPVVGWIAGIILGLISLVVGLAAFVVYVIMLIKAFTGEEWAVPGLGRFVRQMLAKFPA